MSDSISVPASPAVSVFRARHLPKPVFEALVEQDDMERDMARLRPLTSVEDQGDRETLLGQHAAAAKTLATYPSVISANGRSLS